MSDHGPHVFVLPDGADFLEACATLRLAQMAVESIHGPCRLSLQASVTIDRHARRIDVHPHGPAGEDLALILSGFLRREFGDQAVYLRPLSPALHNGGGR